MSKVKEIRSMFINNFLEISTFHYLKKVFEFIHSTGWNRTYRKKLKDYIRNNVY